MSKEFDGVKAVDGVSFKLERGSLLITRIKQSSALVIQTLS